jgi:crotonobetainyl-CoA:carnitine CoA-transferase CaiB-like acyl-CoA transferase
VSPPAPLRGLTVVDLSQYIAGAVCGQLLADYGAEVIKVEPPGGDPSRSLPGTRHGSLYFRSYNTGKRTLALDLNDPAGRARLDDLLGAADAVVMNFGVRSRRRLGLGSERLHDRFPRLVVTVVSAFGADDERTCFDSIAQAVSGFAELNADEDGRPRISAGYPTDVFSGLQAGTATAMALLDPQRPARLEIDVPMIEVAMTMLAGPGMLQAAEERTFVPGQGNRDAATAPSGVYRCRDGHCYVYAGLEKHWRLLQPVVGGPDSTAAERLADRDRFDGIVEAWTAQHDVTDVCARMSELGIPAGPVLDPVAALDRTSSERPGAVAVLGADGQAVPQHPVSFNGRRPVRQVAPTVPDLSRSDQTKSHQAKETAR